MRGGGIVGKIAYVKGNVGDDVKFNSQNASFQVDGVVGNRCVFTTHNGDISVGSLQISSSLITHNGSVAAGDVGKGSSLITHNGDVNARNMAENSRASSHNGSVHVAQADRSATLETHNGDVYENGVKRKKPSRADGVSISIGGMSFVGSIGGRVIIDGRDVTDLVRGSSRVGAAPTPEEPPVRYTKGGR